MTRTMSQNIIFSSTIERSWDLIRIMIKTLTYALDASGRFGIIYVPPAVNIGAPVTFTRDWLTMISEADLGRTNMFEIIWNKQQLTLGISFENTDYGRFETIHLVIKLYEKDKVVYKVEDDFTIDRNEKDYRQYQLPIKFTTGLRPTKKSIPRYSIEVTAFREDGEPIQLTYPTVPVDLSYGLMRIIPVILFILWVVYELLGYLVGER
jgi:hypothetical protein